MKRMSEIARDMGIVGFTADVLATNQPMLGIFQKSGLKVEMELEQGVYHLTLRFEDGSPTG